MTTTPAKNPAPTTAPAPGPALGRVGAVLRSDRLLRIFAWAAVITNGIIAVTGATVRVTGSGLGCSTWPECQPGTLVPEYRQGLAAIHQAIEFTNRTFTGAVAVASIGTFVLLWLRRPRRRTLLWLASVGGFGVLFQAIWGGVVVRQELAWWTVAPHLLVSLVLVFFALVTVVRIDEPDVPARRLVPRPLQALAYATLGVLTALCIAGTLVTAAGPHAGDVDTPRLGLPVLSLAQAHADLMFLYLGLLVALTVGFLAVKAPRKLLNRGWLLIGVTAAQGLLGLVQYATGVPEALVVAHVFGAVLVVLAGTWMVLGTRERSTAEDSVQLRPAPIPGGDRPEKPGRPQFS
ncbi:COX15/CtaA family protein [Nakamurella lactea]|uniref:COX15/CtaA family protein n=1 Tax=Nakamurella lactea TaxID=459515 RepID=UPI0003FFEFCA|nr:COX15/CtaA family protein [Nakamurella lactea]